MGSDNKINKFLKHKRLIILGLIFIGFIVMVFLVYLLTYTNNKPKAFVDDKNVKITNKCDYFDFNIKTEHVKWKNGSTTGEIKCQGEFNNVSQTLTDVSVKFEIHNNWTDKGDYTSDSEHKVNDGKSITSSTTTYYSANATIKLNIDYPIKVLPLVKVKKPTLYAKVTYTRKKPDSIKGSGDTITESVYYRFSFNQYVDNDTDVK